MNIPRQAVRMYRNTGYAVTVAVLLCFSLPIGIVLAHLVLAGAGRPAPTWDWHLHQWPFTVGIFIPLVVGSRVALCWYARRSQGER